MSARVKAKPKAADDAEFFFDIPQRSEDWMELRRGIPTSSKFAVIMAEGKDGEASVTREKYMKLLAGEIVSGQVAESFRSEAMDRGNRMEPEARDWYARTRFVDLTSVGFVRRTVRVPLGQDFVIGCSPDSQVTPKKGLEIKTMAPHLLGDIVDRGAGGFPTGHRAQLQGTMWACDWDQMDLVLFYTGWPKPPVFPLDRDDAYIARLKEQVEKFDYELKRLVERWRR
jgi:hypothetical protein